MNIPNMLGLAGALIAGYAYLPQIRHLVKEHCSAGISSRAFLLWLVSAALITINAAYIRSAVFIILGAVQICSTLTIYILATRYRGQVCVFHADRKAVKINR